MDLLCFVIGVINMGKFSDLAFDRQHFQADMSIVDYWLFDDSVIAYLQSASI
jgi:hypothetical protein